MRRKERVPKKKEQKESKPVAPKQQQIIPDSALNNLNQKVDEVFPNFSEDGKTINTSKIFDLVKSINEPITDEDIEDSINKFKLRYNVLISKDQLIEILQYCYLPQSIIDAFSLFDKDKKGYISTEEFRGILRLVNSELSDRQIDELLQMCDASNNGKIDYNELVNFWSSK